ncbi:hypothetical protein HBI56_121110 [Parastagonospora nodorum]|uniref:Uncharacterized protein n=1 Tax=Phaeosphaeria nodorum (strain SN15 / ATCC MYA-4574 / FGSC 10173) TaxID=321614 RepID=A0A7U2I581_PHANO|nr:hypothetical protein HBH56_053630 [Parastagonospora nodorum]QRD02270.1 hypothetical protein JI435_417720 [Parastagonospora nodorum SN15]KAH3935472.1 hypothetical protein HBH54_039430 [Parastagonospora nodorum]KAH3948644.1 hypothetical protein HBH53_099790 [Parastagonospora nodorum]KAH3969991.1 hypothetical protein HBH51_119400 [Parastagonospora nodorum]
MLDSSLYVASQAQRLATTNSRLHSANGSFECDKDLDTISRIDCANQDRMSDYGAEQTLYLDIFPKNFKSPHLFI